MRTIVLSVYGWLFRGKSINVTNCGAKHPDWALHAFSLEEDLRDKWWEVKEGDVVIDVGAGYGAYTLSALSSGASLVVAYEPSKEDLYTLVANLSLNTFLGKCLILPFLAGDFSNIVGYYPETHSAVIANGDSEYRMMVPIDAMVADKEITRVDWIKIDTEGMEVHVIQGAMKTLDQFHPKLLIENHHGFIKGVDETVRNLLLPLGYKEDQVKFDENSNENWSLYCVP